MTASRDLPQETRNQDDPIDELLPSDIRGLIYDYYEKTPLSRDKKCVLFELPQRRRGEQPDLNLLFMQQRGDSVSAAYACVSAEEYREFKEAGFNDPVLFYAKGPMFSVRQIRVSLSSLDQIYTEFKPTPQASVLTNQQLDRIYDLTGHCHQTREPYNKTLSFFNNIQSERLRKAVKAADDILRGSSDTDPLCIAIVKSDPSLLREVVEVKDALGRKVRGTPLQIAAMARDLDLCKELTQAGKLSREEIVQQLGVIVSPEAKEVNQARKQRALDAVIQFTNDFVRAIKSYESRSYGCKEDEVASEYSEFKKQINDILPSQLQAALTPDPDEVITAGYIFDLSVLVEVIHWFTQRNIAWAGEQFNFYNEHWCINVIGKLQALVSGRDAQFFHQGLCSPVSRIKVSAEELTDLGKTFFLGIAGGKSGYRSREDLFFIKRAISNLTFSEQDAVLFISPDEKNCSHQARPRS